MAFWAPFLLLHLGGPDTITAYSSEDNELWLRHLLGLIVQIAVAFYVFLRSWSRTPVTFLSLPVFLVGIIKYGERTWVLRSASKNQFRDSLLPAPDPGADYAAFMEKISSKTRVEQSTDDDYLTNPSGIFIDKAYFLSICNSGIFTPTSSSASTTELLVTTLLETCHLIWLLKL